MKKNDKVLQQWECLVTYIHENHFNATLYPIHGKDIALEATILKSAVGNDVFDELEIGSVLNWFITTDEDNPSSLNLVRQKTWTKEELVEARTEARALYDMFNE